MSCQTCGRQCQGRLCADCKREERFDQALDDDGAEEWDHYQRVGDGRDE